LLNDAESITEGVLSTEELVVKEFNIIHTFILAGLDDSVSDTIKQMSCPIVYQKLNESWNSHEEAVETKDQKCCHKVSKHSFILVPILGI